MEIVKAVVPMAAGLGLCLGLAAGPAHAQSQGIVTCQIALGQFAEDAVAVRNRLSPGQLDAVRTLVDVGRSQCRSGPQLVLINIQSTRSALRLPSAQQARAGFDISWSVTDQEMALLSR